MSAIVCSATDARFRFWCVEHGNAKYCRMSDVDRIDADAVRTDGTQGWRSIHRPH
jgi:hypothetical protein